MGIALAKAYSETMDTVTLYCDGTHYTITPDVKSVQIHSLKLDFLRSENTLRYTYNEGDRVVLSIGTGELFISVYGTSTQKDQTRHHEYPWSNAFQKIIVTFNDE